MVQDKTIYVGESFTYSFGDAVNRFNQELDVMMDLGETGDFAFYNNITNSYVVVGDQVQQGYWKLNIVAKEVKNGRTYMYDKIFYLRVIWPFEMPDEETKPPVVIDPVTGDPVAGDYLKKESLIRESRDENKPLPYVVDFDSKGVMTIGWTRNLIKPGNYS